LRDIRFVPFVLFVVQLVEKPQKAQKTQKGICWGATAFTPGGSIFAPKGQL
jgi:hypothetical protein